MEGQQPRIPVCDSDGTRGGFTNLRKDFIGLDTSYPVAGGGSKPRIYLDSAAATLMWEPAHRFGRQFFSHYSNTHSSIHHAARISTDVVEWSRRQILSLLGADPDEYLCFFAGSGSTAGFNRLAGLFQKAADQREIVLVSGMEHHSNDLPHRHHGRVEYIAVEPGGGLSVESFEELLEKHRGRVRYATFCAVSNVTGIINPVEELTRIAHKNGVPVIVDGAQAIAHEKICLSPGDGRAQVDAFVFSGHKLYTPGSPGVVVIKRSLLDELSHTVEYGGGMVDDVYYDDYETVRDPVARQEAGTLNIPGIAMLGATANLLGRIGMEKVENHERELQAYALDRFRRIAGIRIYGDTDLQRSPRLGAFAFNVRGLPHSLTAAILNDYFAIAVRNHCFCAHPYVRELLRPDFVDMPVDGDGEELEAMALDYRGMVRVSFGMYSEKNHIDRIAAALEEICADSDSFISAYRKSDSGYQLRQPCGDNLFDPDNTLQQIIAG